MTTDTQTHSSLPSQLPAELPGRSGRVRKNLLSILMLLILTVGVTLSAWPAPDSANSLVLQQTARRALDEDPASPAGRLLSAMMTTSGDATVEILLRDEGGAQANRIAALADALAIARAVYEAPEPRPINMTVLGLAERPSSAADLVPVLYASLPADRLVGRDWTLLGPEDLPTLAGVRWLPAGLCQTWHDCGATRE